LQNNGIEKFLANKYLGHMFKKEKNEIYLIKKMKFIFEKIIINFRKKASRNFRSFLHTSLLYFLCGPFDF